MGVAVQVIAVKAESKLHCDPGSLSPPSMTVLPSWGPDDQVMDPLRWLGLWEHMWSKGSRK